MSDLYNPDIQSAPVFPVNFQVLDNNDKPIYMIKPIKGKATFRVSCAIYVPEDFYEHYRNSDVHVYFSALINKQVADQAVARFPFEIKSNLYRFKVELNLSATDDAAVNIQIACTSKHEGEMGISESIRVGRFVNTQIPIENQGD